MQIVGVGASSFWFWLTQLYQWFGKNNNLPKYVVPYQSQTQQLLKQAEYSRCNQWGTYRGNLYFGMRTRSPHSIMTGLMWYSSADEEAPKVRHYCSLEDGLESWGWHEHDGESYGSQKIVDPQFNLKIEISFVIYNNESWDVEIRPSPLDENKLFAVTLLFYIADEHDTASLNFNSRENQLLIDGTNAYNGKYKAVFEASETTGDVVGIRAPPEKLWDAPLFFSELVSRNNLGMTSGAGNRPNLVAAQYKFEKSSNLMIGFRKGTTDGEKDFSQRSLSFQDHFKNTFKLRPDMLPVCRYALSNMLGSISYFYGTSYVLKENEIEKQVIETSPFELFTDIPSRATFPRGFLWDSGFHNLVLSAWSPKLSLEILESWANRIEHNGWVAREQVPGSEARRAVPVDYIIQNTKHANPPAFLMTLLKLAKYASHTTNESEKIMIVYSLRHIVPKFEKNLKWLIRTQRGQIHPDFCHRMKGIMSCQQVLKLPSFRWRGRDTYHNLNSGLDDYPRSDFPNKYELHVDLACWIAFGARTMLELYDLLGVEGHQKMKRKLKNVYRSVRFSIDHIHWNDHREMYSDLSISEEGKLIYVQHEGYVNLFPLIFGFISPKDSSRLKASLDLIEDRARLWTDYGIRSLSISDPYYMRGDQYWTGPIWININYLVLAALKNHYMDPESPHYEQAKRIYENLRENIMRNMAASFNGTGSIWEQYSDVDGRGMRSHPFTGWSALLILISAEHY